jgi:hypothetical protein
VKSGKKWIDFPQYVHSLKIFSYLCTGFTFKNTSTMAGTIKAMNLIKQVLQLKELGESNRGIARKLPIDKETVNRYMQILSANGWEIPELLKVDDLELVRLEGQAHHDFEQIIDDRYNRKSIILASQLPVADRYNVFQSELIAEACLDRLVHKATRFELKGESLRKKY